MLTQKRRSYWPQILMQENLYQFYKIFTSTKKTLDHLYSTHRDAYKDLPHAPFGKSDHNYILLIPAYKQKGSGQMRKWSDDAYATLQKCFASTDWHMFRDSSNDIEEYTSVYLSYQLHQ